MGTLSHGKMPTLLPIPCSLPKTQKSDERGRRDYTREVCGHREPEHVNREKDETQSVLQGRGRESHHLQHPPFLAESLGGAGPAADGLELILSPPLLLQHASQGRSFALWP